jgi:hypothetical protein
MPRTHVGRTVLPARHRPGPAGRVHTLHTCGHHHSRVRVRAYRRTWRARVVCCTYTYCCAQVSLDGEAVGVGIVVGLLMPFVSNIAPISRALSSTLRNALDVYHSAESEVCVCVLCCMRALTHSRR